MHLCHETSFKTFCSRKSKFKVQQITGHLFKKSVNSEEKKNAGKEKQRGTHTNVDDTKRLIYTEEEIRKEETAGDQNTTKDNQSRDRKKSCTSHDLGKLNLKVNTGSN